VYVLQLVRQGHLRKMPVISEAIPFYQLGLVYLLLQDNVSASFQVLLKALQNGDEGFRIH
jgi:hypothetical protein